MQDVWFAKKKKKKLYHGLHKAHLNQHDNNQCKYRKDDHKNFLPILFHPFVSRFAFFALSFSSFRSLPVVKKIPELAI